MVIVIPGRPITKKNHQNISVNPHTGKPIVRQSDAYNNFEEMCLWLLKKYKVRYKGDVNVCALYWMPNKQSWPDLLGLLQATCDILEKAKIIDNDKYVKSLDGSRIVGVDRDNPRTEIIIEKWEE